MDREVVVGTHSADLTADNPRELAQLLDGERQQPQLQQLLETKLEEPEIRSGCQTDVSLSDGSPMFVLSLTCS